MGKPKKETVRKLRGLMILDQMEEMGERREDYGREYDRDYDRDYDREDRMSERRGRRRRR